MSKRFFRKESRFCYVIYLSDFRSDPKILYIIVLTHYDHESALTSTMSSRRPNLRPYPTDGFPTLTSKTQAETEAVLLKHILPLPSDSTTLNESQPPLPPTLQKKAHMQYLIRNLVQGFPTRYTSQDASQPWMMFWTVQSFGILQVALDPTTKQK